MEHRTGVRHTVCNTCHEKLSSICCLCVLNGAPVEWVVQVKFAFLSRLTLTAEEHVLYLCGGRTGCPRAWEPCNVHMQLLQSTDSFELIKWSGLPEGSFGSPEKRPDDDHRHREVIGGLPRGTGCDK
jgi:hypothetical protein